MMLPPKNWSAFSYHCVGPHDDLGSTGGSSSIEAIHDGVHVIIGEAGHSGITGNRMVDPAVVGESSADPSTDERDMG